MLPPDTGIVGLSLISDSDYSPNPFGQPYQSVARFVSTRESPEGGKDILGKDCNEYMSGVIIRIGILLG